MDNQNPTAFGDDVPAPDFLQLLLSQQHEFPDISETAVPPPDLTHITPLPPPVEPPAFPSSDNDLNHWAEQRLSVYASLDASMNRHIAEAINTLSELKRQAEAEAAQTSYKLVLERDSLRQEVADLHKEQVRLQEQFQETHRLLEEEEARYRTARQEAEVWLDHSRIEREGIQQELRWLKIQVEEARRQLLPADPPRSADVGTGGRKSQVPAKIDLRATPLSPAFEEFQGIPVFDRAPVPAAHPGLSPAAHRTGGFGPEIDFFGDVPTPRILGGSPVIILEEGGRSRSDRVTAPFNDLQDLLMGDFMDTPPAVPEPTRAQAPDPSQAVPERRKTGLTGQLQANPAEPKPPLAGLRLTRNAQPVSHLLNKRRAALASTNPNPIPDPVPAVEPAPASAPVGPALRGARKHQTGPLSASESAQKGGLRELGQQLGLAEPMTPPAFNRMNFAAGYTPPAGVLNLVALLAEIKTSASAIMPTPAAVAATPEKIGKKVVEPPPPVPMDQDLDDYSIDEEPPNQTLEELLEAGEQELAAINEDPTPPENPAPFIGKIGPDHPVHFHTGAVTPRPQPLTMLNQGDSQVSGATQEFKAAPSRTVQPGAAPAPTRPYRPMVRPIRPLAAAPAPAPAAPDFMAPQPQPGPEYSRKTRVIISNLHGRNTLPLLEKVLRDLVGVAQVLVTDFTQGVLVMDVVHRPNFNLVQHLLSIPELRLKLEEEAPGTLAFTQEST